MEITGFSGRTDAFTRKMLQKQGAASSAALMISVLALAGIFLFSTLSICSLENKLEPLLTEAASAAHEGDYERVCLLAERVDKILREHEIYMKICASHRDITDILRCSGELLALGADGERDDYIESLAGIGALIRMLKENNAITLGNIL